METHVVLKFDELGFEPEVTFKFRLKDGAKDLKELGYSFRLLLQGADAEVAQWFAPAGGSDPIKIVDEDGSASALVITFKNPKSLLNQRHCNAYLAYLGRLRSALLESVFAAVYLHDIDIEVTWWSLVTVPRPRAGAVSSVPAPHEVRDVYGHGNPGKTHFFP